MRKVFATVVEVMDRHLARVAGRYIEINYAFMSVYRAHEFEWYADIVLGILCVIGALVSSIAAIWVGTTAGKVVLATAAMVMAFSAFAYFRVARMVGRWMSVLPPS